MTSMLPAMGAQVRLVSKHPAGEQDRAGGRALLIAGAAVAAVAAVAYLVAVATHPMDAMLKGFDLQVYLGGGQQALHHSGNLYTWYYENHPGIQFTYTPFAALLFAAGSALPFHALMALVAAVSAVALAATIWIAFRELGWQPMARAGATLLLTGLVFWTEPVQRALFLGQVELVLMALVVWDLCQPDRRWWKGAATGLAAGIKLVPLLFIVYLVLTRRFRQAAVAVAAFAVTVVIGFAALPAPVRILVARRQLLPGGPDRVRRRPAEPVAARHADPARRKRERQRRAVARRRDRRRAAGAGGRGRAVQLAGGRSPG